MKLIGSASFGVGSGPERPPRSHVACARRRSVTHVRHTAYAHAAVVHVVPHQYHHASESQYDLSLSSV